MKKRYRIQKFGRSHYLCIPSFFISDSMLKNGVLLTVLMHSKEEGITVLELREVGSDGEHSKGANKSGKDAS